MSEQKRKKYPLLEADERHIRRMVKAIEKIEKYTVEGRSKFIFSEIMQDAVIRHLIVIGEAAKHVADPIKQENKDIQWLHVIELKDILIEEYFVADIETIWDFIEAKLSQMKLDLRELLIKDV